MATSHVTAPLRLATLLVVATAACPHRETEVARKADAAPQPSRGGGATTRPTETGAAPGPRASLAAGKPWKRCEGSLSVEDIPTTPLAAVVAGKVLEPTAQAVRGSILGRSIRFDFARPARWDASRPCFIAESSLGAGLEHRDEQYAQGLSLEPGQYRLGSRWTAHYSFEDSTGRRIERKPAYYGLLVIEQATGLGTKPARMFEPTGRVRGKLAICFKDPQQSWIAGAFDMPACGDHPTSADAGQSGIR